MLNPILLGKSYFSSMIYFSFLDIFGCCFIKFRICILGVFMIIEMYINILIWLQVELMSLCHIMSQEILASLVAFFKNICQKIVKNDYFMHKFSLINVYVIFLIFIYGCCINGEVKHLVNTIFRLWYIFLNFRHFWVLFYFPDMYFGCIYANRNVYKYFKPTSSRVIVPMSLCLKKSLYQWLLSLKIVFDKLWITTILYSYLN